MRGVLLSLVLLVSAGAAPAQQRAYMPPLGLAGDVHMPITSMKQARTARTLIQKYDFSCGSAAVATLLTHHYGYPVTEQDVFKEMYEQGDQAKARRQRYADRNSHSALLENTTGTRGVARTAWASF